jgi:alpha-glucosidase
VPGSTYELLRAALALRRERGLGRGDLTWWPDAGDDLVAFTNGALLVLANLGPEPVPLPDGAQVLLSSAPLTPDGAVPTDVTVWAQV